MSDNKIEEGLENFPKPHATPVEPLETVPEDPVQKVTPPTKKDAKRPADNDNPQGMNEEADETIEVTDAEEATIVLEQEVPTFVLSDDIKGLLESLELPEEFKSKALTVFEAAVMGQVTDLHKSMMEANAVAMETYKTTLAEKMEEKVNTYMTESVAKWVEDNQVAVKSNLRTQIAESFMANLVELLETHYITVPENKEDILEVTLEKVSTLEKTLAEEVEQSAKLKQQVFEANKSLALESALAGMSDVDKDRVKTLAESIKETDIVVYKEKLSTIVESFTGEPVKASEFVTTDATGEVTPIVENTKEEVEPYNPIAELGKAISRI